MMKEYVIIDIETNNMPQDGEVIILKANPVSKSEGFEHIESMFGKKYYTYTNHECYETEYFMIKYSPEKCNRLVNIARQYENGVFWQPDLSNFYDAKLGLIDGRIVNIHKDNLLKLSYRRKPEMVEFLPLYEFHVKHINSNGTRIIHLLATKMDVVSRKASGEPNSWTSGECIHIIVPDNSEYNEIVEESLSLEATNGYVWELDVSPFQKTGFFFQNPIIGRVENKLYVHESISLELVNNNLAKAIGRE